MLAALFLIIQFVRPAKTNPAFDSAQALEAHTQISPQVVAIFQRACADCHSNQTRWPWYSHIAPVSWFVTDHVNEGRRHLNFSEWAKRDRRTRLRQFREIEGVVKEGFMPMPSYLLLHRDAKLSDEDVSLIVQWAQTERERQEKLL